MQITTFFEQFNTLIQFDIDNLYSFKPFETPLTLTRFEICDFANFDYKCEKGLSWYREMLIYCETNNFEKNMRNKQYNHLVDSISKEIFTSNCLIMNPTYYNSQLLPQLSSFLKEFESGFKLNYNNMFTPHIENDNSRDFMYYKIEKSLLHKDETINALAIAYKTFKYYSLKNFRPRPIVGTCG